MYVCIIYTHIYVQLIFKYIFSICRPYKNSIMHLYSYLSLLQSFLPAGGSYCHPTHDVF